MSDFLPPDESEAVRSHGGRDEAFYALPDAREALERAYVGTLASLRVGNAKPTVPVPAGVLSGIRESIRAELRAAWPYHGAGDVAERVLPKLYPQYGAAAACSEFVQCIVQGRTPDQLDLIAEKLLRSSGSEA